MNHVRIALTDKGDPPTQDHCVYHENYVMNCTHTRHTHSTNNSTTAQANDATPMTLSSSLQSGKASPPH